MKRATQESGALKRAAVLGAVFGALPGFSLALWALWVNPWFLDRPVLYLGLAVFLPSVLLAFIGQLVGRTSSGKLGFSLLVLPLLSGGLVLRPIPEQAPVKMLVFGVDGATFDILDKGIADGELPAFAQVQGQGTHAVLQSMDPMFSPLLWTTMASGKTPEDHGVRGFHVQATAAKVPRIWDVAEAEGYSVGIYKWLVSYPPRPVDGFIVPAWLAPGPETWPMELSFVKELELSNRLKRKNVAARRSGLQLAVAGIPHGLRVGTLWEALRWKIRERLEHPDDDARFAALHRLRGQIDRDVFIHSLNNYNPDLATFSWFATDGLAHRFWKYHQPDSFEDVDTEKSMAYGDSLTDAYRQADSILSEILERVGPRTTVVILSDHGFKAMPDEQLQLVPLTDRLRARLEGELGPVQVSRLGIRLSVTAEQAPLHELERQLAMLIDDAGLPLYAWELLPGSSDTLGLVLADESPDPDRVASGRVGGEPLADFVKVEDEPFTGDHDPAGVFMAMGPGVPKGRDLGQVQMLDVGPTLQALMGIAPAQDLPGRILLGPQQRGPASRDTLVQGLEWGSGAAGVDEAALRALGYFD